MHKTLPLTAIIALMASPVVIASELEQRLAETEARLAALEQQNSIADRVRVNGFLTFGMQRTNTIRDAADNQVDFQGTDTDWNLRALSRAGIRITTDINDRAHAVVQMLARGEDEFATDMQWAYVAYEISPALTWRAGRLVLPTYMHSQYTQASYAYPWVVLPSQVYGTLPIETLEGMDLTWKFTTGDISHSANLTWGATDVDTATGRYQVQNQTGINLISYWGNLSTRISYSVGETTLALPDTTPAPTGDLSAFSLNKDFGYFASIGGQYDNGVWLLMAELVQLGLNTPASWFPTQTAGYVTAGRRFGKLMPHLTWTTVDSDIEADCAANANPVGCGFLVGSNTAHSKSWTLGARYDLSAGMALKAEATTFYDFTDGATVNSSLFASVPDTSNPTVFRLAVDAAF